MSTTTVYQQKEAIFTEEAIYIQSTAPKPKPSLNVMASVYEALMQAFAQHQVMAALDVSIVHQSIDQQAAVNAKLSELNFNVIPDLDTLVTQEHERFIADLKAQFDAIEPGLWESFQIEQHIRQGTMPNDEKGRAMMDIVRQLWNKRDFIAEARGTMNDKFPQMSLDNTQITKNRECLNNQLSINQQYSQLGASYCQTTASRLSQTSSTFTSCLSTQKEAIEKIWR